MNPRIDTLNLNESVSLDCLDSLPADTPASPVTRDAGDLALASRSDDAVLVKPESQAPAIADGNLDLSTVSVFTMPTALHDLVTMKLRGTEDERNQIVSNVRGPAFGVSWELFDSYAMQFDPAADESVSRLSSIINTFSSSVRGVFDSIGAVALRGVERLREVFQKKPDLTRIDQLRQRQVHVLTKAGSGRGANGEEAAVEVVEQIIEDGRIKQTTTRAVTSIATADKPDTPAR